MMCANRYKAIWGLAKSPELNLDSQSVHDIVFDLTGKDSLKLLTDDEINKVVRALKQTKNHINNEIPKYRTDTEGDIETVNQRKLIYMLTGELGWNNDNRRIDAFCQRMFRMNLKELDYQQCYVIIEALKDMVEREESKHGKH